MGNDILTDGILKSIDSSINQNQFCEYNNHKYSIWVCKYKGQIMCNYFGYKIFNEEQKAKKYIKNFITEIFTNGEHWQKNSNIIKGKTGYDVDYSATIELISSYGSTSKWNGPKNIKIIKDIMSKLLENNIITIEKIQL